ncbi:MAG: two-component sensor histidine kinase, partial [Pedobacter sp.]
MSIGGKIRFLLLILGACCIITAISLRHSITKKELLLHEASKLQDNLRNKERIVADFLSKKFEIENAKKYHLNEESSLDFINKYRDQGINILTYESGELKFWSSVKAIPSNPELIREGTSFLQFTNGWYEVIKKTIDEETIIFLIDVKSQYGIQNQFLENKISTNLLDNNSLALASFSDREVYGISDISGKLLFEVKLQQGYSKSIYASIEIWLWVIGLFSFCLFFNSFCSWLAKRGDLNVATILIALFFLSIRVTDLEFGWFNQQFELDIFNPSVYAESFFLPSLGDLLLNVIAFSWIILFIYTYCD